MKRSQLISRIIVTVGVFFAVMYLVSSCRTMVEIPVENIVHDTCYIKQLERDSIVERDSVIIYTRSDTVYNTRVQWKFRDRVVRDTVYRMRCDTTTVVREVERELTRWQKTKMSVGGYAIVCACLLVAIWFAKRLKGL